MTKSTRAVGRGLEIFKVLGLVALLVGCAEQEKPSESVAEAESNLWTSPGWNTWPTPEVKTCWSPSSMGADLAEWRGNVKNWVLQEIGERANLRITGWARCNLGSDGRMPIGWIRITARTDIGNSAGYGYGTTCDSSIDYGGDSRNPNTSQGVVLHEFMHALGFGHEWERSDNKLACRGFTGTNADGVKWTSTYDAYSIMNYTYCWTYGNDWVDGSQPFRTPTLSATDVAGLQAAYNPKPASYTVSISEVSVATSTSSDWKVVGVGDFNGGGNADLFWRRKTDEHEVRSWLLNGAGGITGDRGVTSIGGAGWKVVGVGDFDGDGLADLAWRRQSDEGEVRIWLLDGSGGLKQDLAAGSLGSTWNMVGVGDFNGDGRADLAWRQKTAEGDEGSVHILLLDGAGGVLGESTVVINGIADWKVVGIGDFNGDGFADLAWRRRSDEGEVRGWLLDGAGVPTKDFAIGAQTSAWQVVGVGDFNYDTIADIAWRRQTDPGDVVVWNMSWN